MASGLILNWGVMLLAIAAPEHAPAPPPPPTPAVTIQQPMRLIIESPATDEMLPTNDVALFIRTENSGTDVKTNRFHVFLDHQSPKLHDDERRPLILRNLSDGGHIARVVAIQADGLAMPQAFAAVRFYVKHKDLKNFVDLSRPYVTVNLPPEGTAPLDEQQRVCFNFLVHNTTLGEKDGYKVHYILDHQEGTLTSTEPIYWGDLAPGRHRLTVELLDASGNPALGLFSRVEREFEVAPVLKPFAPRPSEWDSDGETLPEE